MITEKVGQRSTFFYFLHYKPFAPLLVITDVFNIRQ